MTPNHGRDPTDPRAQEPVDQAPPRPHRQQGTPPAAPPPHPGPSPQYPPARHPQQFQHRPQEGFPEPGWGGGQQAGQGPPHGAGQGAQAPPQSGQPRSGTTQAPPSHAGVQSPGVQSPGVQTAGVPAPGVQTAGVQGAPGQQRQSGLHGAGGSVLAPTTVEDVATGDVVTAEPDTPVRTAVAQMAEQDVGSVVVVEDERPVGIVTDREVALALEDTPDVAQRPIEDLVREDVITGNPSMTLFDALRRMNEQGIRRLPIVDDAGALQGIVTLDDSLVHLGAELGQVAETVNAQSPRL